MEFSTTGVGQTRPSAASPIPRDDGLVEQDKEVAQVRAITLRRRAEADGDIAEMLPVDGALDDGAIMAEAVVAEADLRGEPVELRPTSSARNTHSCRCPRT